MNEETLIAVLTTALGNAQGRIEDLERELSEARRELRIHSLGGDHREDTVSRMIEMLKIMPNHQGFAFHDGDKIRVMKSDTLETVKARMGWVP